MKKLVQKLKSALEVDSPTAVSGWSVDGDYNGGRWRSQR